MDGGGALILGRVRQLLQKNRGDAFPDQRERHHRADRSGAHHDHPVFIPHALLRRIAPYAPIALAVTSLRA